VSRHELSRLLALVLVTAGASLAASGAAAQTAPRAEPPTLQRAVRPAVLSRVEQALRSIDSALPASFWEGLGTEGLAALAIVVDDGSRPLGLRRRAVVAMRHYRTVEARDLLTWLAAAQGTDELVSRYALGSLAAAFGLDALDPLLASLRDERAMVREGAVLALAGLPRSAPSETRVRSALESARTLESELFVREAIDDALARR